MPGRRRASARKTVLLPPIVHGYSPHHMDFPGTISIRWDTFCRYCTDVALSLVRHGFQRVLMVNGHGSNQNLVETAARLAMVEEPESLVAASFYLVSERSARVIEEVRDSGRGGMAHACELETSCTCTCIRKPWTCPRRSTSVAMPRPSTPGWTGRTDR